MSIDKKSLKSYFASNPATPLSLLGTWENELGSMMTITSFDGTNFSGTYSSPVSGGSQPVTGSLAGTVAKGAIGFTVNWSQSGVYSVTSWNGILLAYEGLPAIYSLWNLATEPAQEADFWESILAGADLFIQLT